jgi:hypothetical protein
LNTRVHLPKQCVRQGFYGDTVLISGPLTLVIVKPGTADADIIKSLELTIEAMKLSPAPLPTPDKS